MLYEFFFFEQKPAYELRISDWSSDVCSSDLGQKVWTSLGQWADYGILIARTDPDAPKHRGITYFAFPMRQDGVEVRPLREMTGRALFNEVFLDEARVPHANVIGDIGDGWRVANTTPMVERRDRKSTRLNSSH